MNKMHKAMPFCGTIIIIKYKIHNSFVMFIMDQHLWTLKPAQWISIEKYLFLSALRLINRWNIRNDFEHSSLYYTQTHKKPKWNYFIIVRDSCMLDMNYELWVWCKTSKKMPPWEKNDPKYDLTCRSNSEIVIRLMDARCSYSFNSGK